MQPDYQNVVDVSTMLPTMFAMVVHVVFAALEVSLAAYLMISGVGGLATGAGGSPPGLGLLRTILGVLLLLPLLLGVPWFISLAACLGTAGALILLERAPATTSPRARQRWTWRLALTGTSLVALFIVWEQADAARLAYEVVQNMREWRDHEVDWQQASDARAPKVGDLAPDFELQNADGTTAVQLSAFRGKRPVALVFGSYT